MTQEELNEILELHKKWLNGEEGGIRADLTGVNLKGVKLQGANLKRANLKRANLTDADLRDTDLKYADLQGADLTDIKYDVRTSSLVPQCPEEGSFIAYKYVNGFIVKLEVPADAKRSSATTRKCRCSKAQVLGFYDFNGNELDIDEVVNDNYYAKTIYHKREMVYPDKWDANRWNECSNGIHFLMTFEEAKNY